METRRLTVLTRRRWLYIKSRIRRWRERKRSVRKKQKRQLKTLRLFFISRMMETMFEGISTDGMFGGGQAEKVYRSLLINEYGKAMAKTGSIGVADEVMRSIIEMQEMASQGYINGTNARQ